MSEGRFNVFGAQNALRATTPDELASIRREAQAALPAPARAFLEKRLAAWRNDAHYRPGDTLDSLAERGGRIAELVSLLGLSDPERPA